MFVKIACSCDKSYCNIISTSVCEYKRQSYKRKDGNTMTKGQYIEDITKRMQECNDIPLLDLILKLLSKSL